MLPWFWEQVNSSLKNWLKSLGLGSHLRLKGDKILKLAF